MRGQYLSVGARPRAGRYGAFGTVFVSVVLLLFAVLFAAAIPIFPLKLNIYLVGAIAGLTLLALSVERLVMATLVVTFLVVGPVEYFTGMRIVWIAYGMVILVALRSLIAKLSMRRETPAPIPMPGLLVLLGLFFAVQIAMTLVQRPPTGLLIVEVRDRFLPWLLLLPFLFRQIDAEGCKRIWKLVAAFAFFQLPFVLFQYFYYGRKRTDSTWWDAIVGTFIGDPHRGGDSGAMALFVISVAALMLGLWRAKALSTRYLVLLLPPILGCLLMSEVKVALFLIPLGVLGVFGLELVRRPAVATAIVLSTALIVAGIYTSYGTLFSENASGTGGLESGAKFSFDPGMIKSNGEMGRFAALNYWWNHGGDFLGGVGYAFGNGIGSSNSDNPFELGVVARRVAPVHIAATGAVKLLWEGGVFGLAVFLVLLTSIYVRIMRLAAQCSDLQLRGLCYGLCAIVLLDAAHLFYTKSVIGHTPQIYILVVLIAGVSMVLSRSTQFHHARRIK